MPIECKNKKCRHYSTNKCTLETKISIDENGKCAQYEHGLIYYIDLVYDAWGSSNFINTFDLTDDLRIGIYIMMKIYNLFFSEQRGRGISIIMLHRDENDEGINPYDIDCRKEWNADGFREVLTELTNGELVKKLSSNQKSEEEKSEKEDPMTKLGYGYVSPNGTFTEGDFGDHEETAMNIVIKNNWSDEFEKWDNSQEIVRLARDFLIYEKGYALIHNPSLTDLKVTSDTKRVLTKPQNKFLFEYFSAHGDKFLAEKYAID